MLDEPRVARRYCGIVQLSKSSNLQRIAQDVPVFMDLFKRWSKGEMEQLCRSNDGQLFGFFFKSDKPEAMLTAEFETCGALATGDSFVVFEIGEKFSGAGFSRAWTWLQRH
jgi:hypothetical protein